MYVIPRPQILPAPQRWTHDQGCIGMGGRHASLRPTASRPQLQASIAFLADSIRPPRLWQPSPSTCLTVSGTSLPFLCIRPMTAPADGTKMDWVGDSSVVGHLGQRFSVCSSYELQTTCGVFSSCGLHSWGREAFG